MSDSLPFTPGALPEANTPLYLAMQDIASATEPQQIVDALHRHILGEIDRISLVRLQRDIMGAPVGKVLATWDRDEIALDAGFPSNLHELIEDQPLVVVDTIYLDEFLAPVKLYAVDWLQVSSIGIFPLKVGDLTTGYLVVAARKTRLQDDREVRQLLMLCWQIAAMIHNFEVAEDFRKQSDRSVIMGEASEAISSAMTGDELGQALTTHLNRLFSLTHLSAILLQPESGGVRDITWHGEPLAGRSVLNDALFDQILRSGETAFLGGMGGPDETGSERESGVQKLLVIPMGTPGNWIGTLNIGLRSMTDFSIAERRMCELIARLAGAVLSRTAVSEHLQRSLHETTTLYSTTLALTASQSVDEITSTVLSELAQLASASRITMYLGGPDPWDKVDYVEVAATWKNNKVVTPSSLRYPIAEAPVLGQFPQSRSNLIFNDIQQDTRLTDTLRTYYAEEGVDALMMIPVSTGAMWLGALLIESHKGHQFSEEQSRLCRSLADQAALALDSQLLLARTRQAVAREKALRDITDQIRKAVTVEEIMSITADELSKIMGVPAEKLAHLSMSDSVQIGLSHSEREFVDNVVAQVELAIHNLRLLDSVRQAAQTEQAIGNITIELARASEVNEVMETAVRTLQNNLDDYDVRIRLLPPTGGDHRLGTGRLKAQIVEQHEDTNRKKKHKSKKSLGTEPLN